MGMAETRINNHAGFIWSVADRLRGDYKRSEYGKVILPLMVLRRFDCVLEPATAAVLARAAKVRGQVDNVEPVLCAVAGQRCYNVSLPDFPRLLHDPAQVAGDLRAYVGGFRFGAREVLEKFDFDTQRSNSPTCHCRATPTAWHPIYRRLEALMLCDRARKIWDAS